MERELARLAAAAHGVVSRARLLEIGVTRDEIAWRLRTGALLRGLAAAFLWGLVRGAPPPPEVATPTERRLEGCEPVACAAGALRTRRRGAASE